KAIFGTPLLNSWMRNALHPQINNLFYSKEFRQRGIWNLPKIHNHWQHYLKGDGRQAEMLYNIIAMEVWLQTFIKNDPVI
ncbi:MAG: asparagine synthetase B, partial [Candidatus Cloacimonetes bacterium]|nr:asparagine synthetase B [Candidatus Cloacimonadota bacterium]